MTPPAQPRLVVAGNEVDLSRPLLMGILDAASDSASDGRGRPGVETRVARAVELVRQGAGIVDVGGQPGGPGGPEGARSEEIAQVLSVVEGIRREQPDVLLSVDAFLPSVVDAVLAAGASIINDVSGLQYPEVADLCAQVGAALVLPSRQLDQTARRGFPPEATIFDPAPDLAGTPHQAVTVLDMDEVTASGRPVLLSPSCEDVVSAITGGQRPQPLVGTLAVIGHVVARTGGVGCILRVHEVADVADYLRVRAVLAGRETISEDLSLPPHLRREKPAPS